MRIPAALRPTALLALPTASVAAAAEGMALARVQVEALLALPTLLTSLNEVVLRLSGTLEGVDDALAVLKGVAARADGVLDDFEQPLRDLLPGIVRIGPVLAHPTFDQVPETLVQVQDELLPQVTAHLVPLFGALGGTQEQVASIAQAIDRLMALLDDVEGRLSSLPLLRSRGGKKSAP